MSPGPIVDPGRGLGLVFRGERYWIDLDTNTQRVTVDLQHHGMMGQPGEIERVGDGVWTDDRRITSRSGTLAPDAFDAAEVALRAHVQEGERGN